ncbi:copper resistance protein CopC [Microbacterium sp. 179-I 3D4 NHS]|uniref:copper resistance CopC family protein n=1 Tax=Microbacterium sp. 179-I 3D4 NHS TaxID=3142381 RepID=UPI0039A03A34
MKTTAARRPVAPLALAASLLAAFLVLFAPLPASAHDALISSSPEADATVDTLPGEITLTFSADLIAGEGATEVVVTDADGASVIDGPAVTEGAVVTQPLVAEAAAGSYHVVWKVVSSDGHPTSGEYFFTVSQGSSATTTPSPEPTPTVTAAAPSEEPTTTPAPAETGDDTSASAAWIWVLAIVGVIVIAAAVTTAAVLARRGRRNTPPTDSDLPAAR